jgi:hypothetical protein
VEYQIVGEEGRHGPGVECRGVPEVDLQLVAEPAADLVGGAEGAAVRAGEFREAPGLRPLGGEA